jgi:hypothetical protein
VGYLGQILYVKLLKSFKKKSIKYLFHSSFLIMAVEYRDVVYKGMEHRFPLVYVNKYLIDHCKNRFGMCCVKTRQNKLYHDYERPRTEFMRVNPEFYDF